jgi:hypothetical protein
LCLRSQERRENVSEKVYFNGHSERHQRACRGPVGHPRQR